MRLFFSLSSLLAILLVIQSCDSSNPYEPDYSTVPAAFDTTKAVKDTTTEDGLKVYVLKEGSGPFQVTSRDQIAVRYTKRTADGTILESTYADGNTGSVVLRNLSPVSISLSSGSYSPLIEGYRRGILLWGMKEGEKRTLVIPPALGYGSSSNSLQDKTLVYDIELVSIL